MKVSFITGVYNSERYLSDCIESMLAQTYQDIEIILVVNACRDGSAAIANAYEKKYPKVVRCFYVDKKLGAGGSREYGLLYAKGDYIAFVDNDDVLDKQYIERMISMAIEKNEPDIITCNFCKITENGDKIIYKRILRNKREALIQSVAPWAKIYKKDFLLCNNLFPRNIPFGEDVIFSADVYMADPQIIHCDFMGYFWRDNSTSTSHTELADFPEYTFEKSKEYFDEIYEKYAATKKEELSYFLFKYYMWYLLNSGRKVTKSKMGGEYDRIYQYFLEKDWEWNNWHKRCIYISGERKIVSVVLILLRILDKLHLLRNFFLMYCGSFLGRFWPSL